MIARLLCGRAVAHQRRADPVDVHVLRAARLSVSGRSILFCHDADGLYAVENKCSHADMPLA